MQMGKQRRRSTLAAAILTLAPVYGQQQIGLRVSEETVPAGSVAQIKVSVTEPKPIIHGEMAMGMDFSFDLLGIALYSSQGTVSGIAYRKPGGLRVRFTDPSATMGMEPDYPVLTLAVRVPEGAPAGMRMPVNLNLDTSRWVGPTGFVYEKHKPRGWVAWVARLAYHNVAPGGGRIGAGETFRILGTGFRPDVRVDIEYVEDIRARYVNGGEIEVTAGTAFDLDGKRIRVRHRDEPDVFYFSYLRGTRRTASRVALLEGSEPIFPMKRALAAIGAYPFPRGNQVMGIALQNPNRTEARVTITALSRFLQPVATATIPLAAGEELVQAVEELLPEAREPGVFLYVRSTLPFQYVPLAVDTAAGEIQPLLFATLSATTN